MVDARMPVAELEYVGGPKTPALVAETDAYKIFAVRWPVLPGVDGEGLLLEPKRKVGCCRWLRCRMRTGRRRCWSGLAPGVPKEGAVLRVGWPKTVAG